MYDIQWIVDNLYISKYELKLFFVCYIKNDKKLM